VEKAFPWYPLFVDVERRNAVVVGGGSVSVRKVETLLHYGAVVTVIAPEFDATLQELERAGRITVRRRGYESGDLEGAFLAIAATDRAEVNAAVADDARSAGILVNVVDMPQLSTFIVPAVVEEGSIQIAISTGGRSPALARRLKHEVAAVTAGFDTLGAMLGSLRATAKSTLPTDADRKRFFDAVIESRALDLLRQGAAAEARAEVVAVCERFGVDPGVLASEEPA
jgi:precorrin-2 dehydrogenase/sirohydrochlorin ferrochelatase